MMTKQKIFRVAVDTDSDRADEQRIQEAVFDSLWDVIGGVDVSVRQLSPDGIDGPDLEALVTRWEQEIRDNEHLSATTKHTYTEHVRRFLRWTAGDYQFPGG